MCGIYSWVNNITGEKYIGQSVDIETRKKEHIRFFPNGSTKLCLSVQKYGLNNFSFEVLCECKPQELNEKEKFFIKKYDTVLHGLNKQWGGTNVQSQNNPNTELTNEDVLEIRNRIYLNKERITEVYKDYQSKIGISAFWELIHGITWKEVDCSMIYDLSSIGYSNFDGSKNPKAKVNEEDVKNIRLRSAQGETNQSIYQDYIDKISYSAFCKIIRGETWKNIKVENFKKVAPKIERKGLAKAKLTPDNVKEIRKMASENISFETICKRFPWVTANSVRRVIKRETWKNVN